MRFRAGESFDAAGGVGGEGGHGDYQCGGSIRALACQPQPFCCCCWWLVSFVSLLVSYHQPTTAETRNALR